MSAVPAGRPHVALIVEHRAMRALMVDLLDRDGDRWVVSAINDVAELGDTVSSHPDLVVIDTADFKGCCSQLPPGFAVHRVVVIGPEPDPAYRHAALTGGAGAWLSRECVAEELCNCLRSALAAHDCHAGRRRDQPQGAPTRQQAADADE